MLEEFAKKAEIVNERIKKCLTHAEPKDLYEGLNYVLEAGGKRIRPALVLLTTEMLGGNPDKAMPAALAVEMAHNFSLIHDEIQDGQDVRRGRETLYKKMGVNKAINAGDLMHAWAYHTIISTETDEHSKIRMIEVLVDAMLELGEGQHMDLDFVQRWDITEAEYLLMVRKKTGALLKASLTLAGILSKTNMERLYALAYIGERIGPAFQLRDDVLDLTADEAELGKPVGNDIREGKKTLMLIKLMEKATDKEKAKIRKIAGDKKASADDVEYVKGLMGKYKCIEYVQNMYNLMISEAKDRMDLFPDNPAKKELGALLEYVVNRRK